MGRTYFQSIRDMDSLADLLAGMGETELSSLGGG